MTHVLIMSVGPVQEFIAGGRKCRDLWFGSWLLSEVAVAAAKAIQAQAGDGALVFPGGLAVGRDTSAANKIVARVAESQGLVAVQQIWVFDGRGRITAEHFPVCTNDVEGRSTNARACACSAA